MIEKIRKSLNEGYKILKWMASFLAERTRAETSIAKLLYEINKLERKMDELYIEVGKRVIELREKGEETVFNDFIIQQTSAEIRDLQESVEEYKEKAKTLNKLPE
jgi:chromosome condensin MukBEF complex kleisin-like MukF subunit